MGESGIAPTQGRSNRRVSRRYGFALGLVAFGKLPRSAASRCAAYLSLLSQVTGEPLGVQVEEAGRKAEPVLSYLDWASQPAATGLGNELQALRDRHSQLQKSIEQHLQGVREERAAQAAFEEKVASLREGLLEMERDIGAAPTCGDDEDQVQKNLQMLRERLSFLDREVRATSRSAHERYSERRQGVPEVVEQALASVELLSENVMAALEGKEREFKKARTARADYCEGSKALAAWLQKAQGILQRKGDSPEVTKENLVALNAEVPGVRRDAERRVVQSGNLVVECLGDTEQARSVRATIASLTDQLQQVESWIRERLSEVEDALEAWARFLQLHEAHKTWLDTKELAVAKRQPLNTLAVARQCLSQCQEVNRDMASGQGQLAEMSGLVQRIGRSCHVGPLLEKLDAAEERQRNLEGRLVQELALLQELVEEWEQCERKVRWTVVSRRLSLAGLLLVEAGKLTLFN
ncbi:hypothetical protein HPB51_003622 [Rhipicephalus microplus]|uniref:Uncharacterized protein n=1 Tax=Rhipicephalus microplus TaxID=6941 RepID=A0A9J6DYW9_RHIMP|nr:hypothetical protein HPB51_003622 [Rhipicephalus microplus]